MGSKKGNIYHCCIQKSGSQWVTKIMADSLVAGATERTVVTPGRDYIMNHKGVQSLREGFGCNAIVSPLYVTCEQYEMLPDYKEARAFYVMRDPRDLLVSRYFAEKEIHNIMNEWQKQRREMLNDIGLSDGIKLMIEEISTDMKKYYYSMKEWATCGFGNVRTVKSEDLIGGDGVRYWSRLLGHLDIGVSDEAVQGLLAKYSFRSLSGGREQGVGAIRAHHYRKGISGDWKNYFNDAHRRAFKENAQDLLFCLGYEQDDRW